MDTTQLEKRIAELEAFMNALKSSNSIPIEVDGAFRRRFLNVDDILVSSKSASSENQAVDESGTSSFNVLKPPDGFLQKTINGSVRYIPYYN